MDIINFDDSPGMFQAFGRDCAAWNYDDWATDVLAFRYGIDPRTSVDFNIVCDWGDSYLRILINTK